MPLPATNEKWQNQQTQQTSSPSNKANKCPGGCGMTRIACKCQGPGGSGGGNKGEAGEGEGKENKLGEEQNPQQDSQKMPHKLVLVPTDTVLTKDQQEALKNGQTYYQAKVPLKDFLALFNNSCLPWLAAMQNKSVEALKKTCKATLDTTGTVLTISSSNPATQKAILTWAATRNLIDPNPKDISQNNKDALNPLPKAFRNPLDKLKDLTHKRE